ncbi:MAG: CehA/McbA family metallohydrolase [Desulfovermiculus sp.]|nr:CehA/McbA family metallohydrolase [Desulfovermiculus sp.]
MNFLYNMTSPGNTSDQDLVRVTGDEISIPDGDASDSGDLVLMNNQLICKFATQTKPPWGMPPGGLLDISPVVKGQPLLDLVNIFDFLPDNWCSWPNTYHRIQALESGADKGVVRVERDWDQVHLVTDYTLRKGENVIYVITWMTHAGNLVLEDIQPGYTLYMKGGHMLSPPGLQGIKEGRANEAMTWSFIGYDQAWCIALHAPYVEYIDHFGQDMFGRLSLAPGETRSVEAWIQVCAHSNISEILGFELEQRKFPRGILQGRVLDQAGQMVPEPYVVVEQKGQTLTWAQGQNGRYSLSLPPGTFKVQAMAKHYSQSRTEEVTITQDQTITQDFSGLQSPARLSFQVTDARDQSPLDARIDIAQGPAPVIGFLGDSRYFTDLESKGWAELTIPPGEYVFQISHGGGFLGLPREIPVQLQAEDDRHLDIELQLIARPAERGWYGADLHHHGDVLDGVTSPEFVVRSQLACGLDILFLSDHDATKNNDTMAGLTAKRSVPFLPAMEISPAWGHFNIYPVTSKVALGLDPGSSTAAEIFSHARKLGAEVVVINHPYSTYGYLRSLDLGVAPGGYVNNFDLLEINYQYPVEQTLHKAWEFWNQGKPIYLTAGTDTHSVWQDTSGAVRMYVYVQAEITSSAVMKALKAGSSYATFGPLIFPEIPFGQEVTVPKDQGLNLIYDLVAVHGLQEVQLIHNGQVADSIRLEGAENARQVQFPARPAQGGWYALVVSDVRGHRAFTNPLWVKIDNSGKHTGV